MDSVDHIKNGVESVETKHPLLTATVYLLGLLLLLLVVVL